MRSALSVLLVMSSSAAMGAADASLRSLYDNNRWFDLREAIAGKEVPPLYRGAASAAFNDLACAEEYLDHAIAQATMPDDIIGARSILTNLYIRLGRHRDAVRQIDEMLKVKPHDKGLRNVRSLFAVFGQYPDQCVGGNRHAIIHTAGDDGSIPLTINGRALHWILDTGAGVSLMGQSEARMLGLTIYPVREKSGDLNGVAVKIGATVVPKLTVGEVEICNVAFQVMADSRPPVNERSPGARGIIGLPVLIALRNMRMTTDGAIEFGFSPGTDRPVQNLYFDGLSPVTRVGFAGRQLDFLFDTGNGAGTQLWRSFAREFPEMMKERGASGKKKVTQIGGSKDRDVVVLPEVRLTVGGKETILRPANVFSNPVGNEYQHGLLGTDLLSQASEVSIDFQSLSVRLQ